MAQQLKTDWTLFGTTVFMVFFGALMIFSASSVMAQLKMGSSYYFVERQVLWIGAALAVMMLLKKTHYRKLQNPSVAFACMGFALMLLFAVYFIDRQQHRWIRLGLVGVQPSELAKPAMVIFLAFFVALRSKAINNKHTLIPASIAVGFLTLGVVIADLGTAIVLMATAATVFFVAGLERRYCAIVVGISVIGMVFFVVSKPYRVARVVEFFDPGYKMVDKIDPAGRLKTRLKSYMQKSFTTRDTGYQALQSQIAVGAGGPLGQGPMQGKQKLLYLPEAHTDFIYAVVSEEWGLIGSVGILLGFGIILWRGIRAAVLIQDEFGRYLAIGITVLLVVQAFLNMSVVLGMVPTKGIPLPMISFGGSSLLSTLALLGILQNVSEHAG
ncbi:MAG: putative lipid II flippase FtsW [Acidobacteriota bacterium]|nr:putative lipid II flippase FtsW [Acidobacteriota bacterium]